MKELKRRAVEIMPKITKGDYEWLSQRILQELLATAIPETNLDRLVNTTNLVHNFFYYVCTYQSLHVSGDHGPISQTMCRSGEAEKIFMIYDMIYEMI